MSEPLKQPDIAWRVCWSSGEREHAWWFYTQEEADEFAAERRRRGFSIVDIAIFERKR